MGDGANRELVKFTLARSQTSFTAKANGRSKRVARNDCVDGTVDVGGSGGDGVLRAAVLGTRLGERDGRIEQKRNEIAGRTERCKATGCWLVTLKLDT